MLAGVILAMALVMGDTMKFWIMTISLLLFAAIVYGLLIRDIRIHMRKKDNEGESQ